ncbi:MAG TPA: class I SAM-dependent methyltransferase [Acidimicrobiales bacterium]|nr:class I SAM-dependent methyltransferase [Acidimicrobiales bacterium]
MPALLGDAEGTTSDGGNHTGFDALASHYELEVDRSVSFTGRSSRFFAQRKVALLRSLVRRHLRGRDCLKLLDVGCGTGMTAGLLVPHFATVCGVDVSREMLAEARKVAPGAAFCDYNGTALPYGPGEFDVTIAICVLHHVALEEQCSLVKEMLRVTSAGGLVAIFEHNPFNPLTRLAVRRCAVDHGVTLVPGRRAARLLEAAGAGTVSRANFLFSPLGGWLGASLDRVLAPIPLGGQYVVFALR